MCRAAAPGRRAPGTSRDRCSRRDGTPRAARPCHRRIDAERLQLVLDDAGELVAPARCRHGAARRRGTCGSPAAAETGGRTSPPPSRARPAARCRAARRRSGCTSGAGPPVSIENVSPTAGVQHVLQRRRVGDHRHAPSANARRSSSHGFARSASVSALRRREREAVALDEARSPARRSWDSSDDRGSGSSRPLPDGRGTA